MFKSIGSDVEVFAINKDGKHVALCGKIGGTKENPLQIAEFPDGFMLQEDNVALEYNIPVCYEEYVFVNSIRTMRNYIKSYLEKMGLDISNKASVSFAESELSHPNALIFGCEPDYNAWKMVENKKPSSKDPTLRTAGGHIHVGTDMDMLECVKNMDLFMGIPSVILDDCESSINRRELYGKAGAMRPKSYGIEYRVLSNFWMFSDLLASWVFDQTVTACINPRNLSKKEGERIQKCINTSNKEDALAIIEEYKIVLPNG